VEATVRQVKHPFAGGKVPVRGDVLKTSVMVMIRLKVRTRVTVVMIVRKVANEVVEK
jgi:hypothetical protein